MEQGEGAHQPDWLSMAEAMAALQETGKHPDEAASLLFEGLGRGILVGRARHILTEYTDGITEHEHHIVPHWIWQFCPMPPLGHDFWSKGDVRIDAAPLPDGSVVRIGERVIELPLGGLLPITTIRGLRLSRDGVLALCRSIGGPKGRGRRKGAGSLAAMDEPLMLEMRRLMETQAVVSIHQAALKLAKRAEGAGTEDSRVKRLLRRYRERYPNR